MSLPKDRPSPGQRRPRDRKSRCLERLSPLHHCPLLAWPRPPCLPGPPAPIQQALSLPFVELLFGNLKLLTQENHRFPLQPYLSFIATSSVISHISHASYPDRGCQMSKTKSNYEAPTVIHWTLKTAPKENYRLVSSWDTHPLPSMTTLEGNPGQDTYSPYSWFLSYCPMAV